MRDRLALVEFCTATEVAPPAPGSTHHIAEIEDVTLRWEQHSEFTTYSWILAGSESVEPSFRERLMCLLPQPGALVASVDLILSGGDVDACENLDPASLAVSMVHGGAAIVSSDFRADDLGFVRIYVADKGLGPLTAGALTQRLLELETYRLYALMGLMEARRLSPLVQSIERDLANATLNLTLSEDLDANQALLHQLTNLAAKLEASATTARYRFAATRAYAEIVDGRLEVIGDTSCGEYPTFSQFLSRRLAPALRTCATMESRHDALANTLAQTGALLRTRVEVETGRQSRALLTRMGERIRIQLRLQQTVEALSVVAVAYYVLQLLGAMVGGLHAMGRGPDPSLFAAAAVVPLLLIIALIFRWTHRYIEKKSIRS
jgi:uncharacterized membrane-anchored protein